MVSLTFPVSVLFACSYAGVSQNTSLHPKRESTTHEADESSTKPGKYEFLISGEVLAYPEFRVPEILKAPDGASTPLFIESYSLQQLLSMEETEVVLRPRALMRNEENFSLSLPKKDKPHYDFDVSVNMKSGHAIRTKVAIRLYSSEAPYGQTDYMEQTRLVDSSADKYQVFGPLKQDDRLVFTLLKIEPIINDGT